MERDFYVDRWFVCLTEEWLGKQDYVSILTLQMNFPLTIEDAADYLDMWEMLGFIVPDPEDDNYYIVLKEECF